MTFAHCNREAIRTGTRKTDMLLASWTKTDTGIALQRPSPHNGGTREFLMASVGHVSTGDLSYWAIIPEGGPEFRGYEQDMACLERTFGVSRYELGGHMHETAAQNGTEAVAEALLSLRAPVIEAFVPRLLEAIEVTLAEGRLEPILRFLESNANHHTAAWWLLQAVVGEDEARQSILNPSAVQVLKASTREGTLLEVEIAPSNGIVGHGLLLVAKRGERSLPVLIDGYGHVGAHDGEGWVAASFPPSAGDLAAEGETLLSSGDAENALPLLERAATLDGAPGIVHFHLGGALSELGRTDEAIAAFEIAEAKNEGEARVLSRLNRATLIAATDRDASIALLQKTTGEFPGEAMVWYSLGLALVKAGRHGESIDATARAIALSPDHANAHYSIACAHALRGAAGDVEKALEHIGSAVEIEPDLTESIASDDDFESLRKDPRFVALVS